MTSSGSKDPRTALLDAAERLLVREGYAAISTRAVAGEARVNHGLVHYYFGSVDNLLLETLKRATSGLHERQRAMYAGDEPFIEKWRRAMGYLTGEDQDSGYAKLWMELQAMSWNNPEMREHLAEINAGWREILSDAFAKALSHYGVDTEQYPVEALVALVFTFNEGFQLEQIGGIDAGHDALLQMIDGQLERWEEQARVRTHAQDSDDEGCVDDDDERV